MAIIANSNANVNAAQQLLNNYGPVWAILVLVVGLAYLVAGNTWKVIEIMVAPDASALYAQNSARPFNGLTQNRSENQNSASSSTYTIVNQNLFGRVELVTAKEKSAAKLSAPAEDKQFTETRLPLTLEGVFLNENPDYSRSFISEKRGGTKVAESYAIGDDVPGNAVVSAIYKAHVVLQRGASYETLRFPQKDQMGKSGPLANAYGEALGLDRINLNNNDGNAGGVGGDNAGGMLPRGAQASAALSRPRPIPSNIPSPIQLPEGVTMEQVMSGQMPDDPAMLETMAKTAMEQFGMKLEGDSVKISAQAAQLGSVLGLQENDEILDVDGHSPAEIMNDPQLLMELYKQKENVKVRIKSGDTEKKISVPKW